MPHCVQTLDICELRPDPGLCKGFFPSYFHNYTSGRCEEFIYGGCGGNDNRFSTLEECQQECGKGENELLV